MIPTLGIDLGTTFSCVSYIDENGLPVIIPNSDGQQTTPSVVWCDGKVAYVGKKANDRKLQANAPIFEFFKRDIGEDSPHRYVINQYDFRACGLSAILLRKLRMEAFNHFRKKGLIAPEKKFETAVMPAVITVPAYFHDKHRNHTKQAGIAAGFDVIAILNEPTAAALTYGVQLNEPKKILVFDLGGGTFDVTVLEVQDGEAIVQVTKGANRLGGRDWDSIIERHFYSVFAEKTGVQIPDDMGWEIQKLALEAKFHLSNETEFHTTIFASGESVDVSLYRESESVELIIVDVPEEKEEEQDRFYFEERAQDKLSLCRAILSAALAGGGLGWNDIDEIVLAGGASRMPMIPKMLEKISGKKIRVIPGYDFDKAIAQGAAIFSRNRDKVIDVCSKSVGIEVSSKGRDVIRHLIKSNSQLPVTASLKIRAQANAILKVYEGDDDENPELCAFRGELRVKNPEGEITVNLSLDANGLIRADVESNGTTATLKIISGDSDIDVNELKVQVDKIEIRL